LTAGKFDTTSLKAFAPRLPPDSALKYVLLLEKDEVPVSDFIARLPLYLALADKTLEE